MAKEERSGLVWVIIALLVLLVAGQLVAWLEPRPYRWTEHEDIVIQPIEFNGKKCLLFESGVVLEMSEEEWAEWAEVGE